MPSLCVSVHPFTSKSRGVTSVQNNASAQAVVHLADNPSPPSARYPLDVVICSALGADMYDRCLSAPDETSPG